MNPRLRTTSFPDPMESFRNNNVGSAFSSKHAKVMTIEAIIRMQEVVIGKVPRLRTSLTESDAIDNQNDGVLSKIQNDFEHEEPKPDDEDQALTAGDPKKSRFMVIHVGAPATGAKRFQKDTALNPGLADALAKDGILYVGSYSPDETRDDFINQKICSQIFLRNKFDLELLKSIDPFGEMPLASGPGSPHQICTSTKCLKDCWSNKDGDKYDTTVEDETKKEANESKRLNLVKNMSSERRTCIDRGSFRTSMRRSPSWKPC